MNDAITLCPITAGDEAFLYQVYASTRQEEMALVDWDDAQKQAFLRMQFHAQHTFYHAEFPNASYQLILRQDTPVGRLYVDRREHDFCILDITLLPEYRRQGIGGELLQQVLAEADRAGKPVRIHVERFNPALRLYERLGFCQVSDQGVYYLMERPWPGVRNPGNGSPGYAADPQP
jgi:ribosomal protein S18 acetylase RimI-like enzyme